MINLNKQIIHLAAFVNNSIENHIFVIQKEKEGEINHFQYFFLINPFPLAETSTAGES